MVDEAARPIVEESRVSRKAQAGRRENMRRVSSMQLGHKKRRMHRNKRPYFSGFTDSDWPRRTQRCTKTIRVDVSVWLAPFRGASCFSWPMAGDRSLGG